MIHTVQHMLKMMRAGTNEDIEYPDTNINVEIDRLDTAQDDLYRDLLRLKSNFLPSFYDLALTGLAEYDLPFMAPAKYCRILGVFNVTTADSFVDTIPTYWSDRMQYQEGNITTGRVVYNIRDKKVETPNKDSDVTLRFWYARKPVGFLYGTAGGGSSTTIIFPTTPTAPEYGVPVPEDDYYNGMLVHCNNEVKIITDYVTSTKTATISGTWITTPLNTHAMSLVSPLPEQYHTLIPDIAKRLHKVDNDDDDSFILRLIQMKEDKVNAEFANENLHTFKMVKRITHF